jgi:hypothetical protein
MSNRAFDPPNSDGKIKRHTTKAFQPETLEKIYESLEGGLPMKLAAQNAGILENTAYRWIEDGLRDEKDYEDGCLEHRTDKAVFYVRCKQAAVGFMRSRIENINKAGDETINWRANTFSLEKLDDELFGKRQTINHAGGQQNKLIIEVVSSQKWLGEDDNPLQIASGDVFEAEYADYRDTDGDEEDDDDTDE